jgi:hypothetical protein
VVAQAVERGQRFNVNQIDSSIISRGLSYSIATGNWTEDSQKFMEVRTRAHTAPMRSVGGCSPIGLCSVPLYSFVCVCVCATRRLWPFGCCCASYPSGVF